jgi:hypothetical protein
VARQPNVLLGYERDDSGHEAAFTRPNLVGFVLDVEQNRREPS